MRVTLTTSLCSAIRHGERRHAVFWGGKEVPMRMFLPPRARSDGRLCCSDDRSCEAPVVLTGSVDEVPEAVERRLRRAAQQHAGWLAYLVPLGACGFDLGDLFLTGDFSAIGNRAWLAVHLAVTANTFTRQIHQVRAREGRSAGRGRWGG